MADKKQIEQLLRVNGLSATSGDKDICDVLLASGYKDEEIEQALSCVREQGESSVQQTGTYKLFRSGEHLKPAEISQLLGVDVVVNEVNLPQHKETKVPFFQLVLLWLTSVVIAAAVVMGYMYTEKIGVFHPAMKTISLE